jgi:Ammonium Transporter Family
VKIDTGSTAWMMASTALVLLMTPGLAFFYGGMTRAKTALNMMMMSRVAIITVALISGAAGRGRPVIGTKSLEDRDEPLPLPPEHVQHVLWIEVARSRGLQ